MIISALIGLLVGMLVAQRFTVLILIPILFLSIFFVITIGVARGERFWTVALASVITVIAVQIGYLLGMAIHQLLVVARTNRMQPLQRRRPAQWPSVRLTQRLR